jgi:Zn-dependent M28 family amino/carboxypeptidase
MDRRLSATTAALLAVLCFAGAAQAARPDTPLRAGALSELPSRAVAPGATLTVTGTLRNRGRHAVRRAGVVLALSASRGRRLAGMRVGSTTVGRLRARQRRRFRVHVTVPAGLRDGARLLVCASSPGARGVCATARGVLRVARPAGGPAEPPAPGPTPAATPVPTPIPTPTPGVRTTPPAPGPPAITPAPPSLTPTQRLDQAITIDALVGHAAALQDIADRNGTNRAATTPGYEASVDYVVAQLRAAGYDPQVQSFRYDVYRLRALPVFEQVAPAADGWSYGADYWTMEMSGSGDVQAPAEAVDVTLTAPRAVNTSGCEAADFAGFTPGHIALMQRSAACDFDAQVQHAQDAGAAAVVFFADADDPADDATILGRLTAPVGIPVLQTSGEVGEPLATTAGLELHVSVDALAAVDRESKNVIAQTAGGRADGTLVLGAHLDSVPVGPGIDDNGSSVAYLLELARQLSRLDLTPAHRVRFAFFGSEEEGEQGSAAYVDSLSGAQLDEIAAYLNFDMLASPNYGRFVYDGSTGPPGSLAIQEAFQDALSRAGLASELIVADGRADHGPFQAAGVPAGGLFSGAELLKTPAQVALYGGTAGVAFDANYHQPTDTLDQLNLVALRELTSAATDVAMRYAFAP